MSTNHFVLGKALQDVHLDTNYLLAGSNKMYLLHSMLGYHERKAMMPTQ